MKRSRRGHTLIELLAVLAIMALTSTVVLAIFLHSSMTFEYTSAKIGLQGQARELLKRVGPILVSGIQPDASYASAVIQPALLAVESDSIVFATTEDYQSEPQVSPPNRCEFWTGSIPSPIPIFYYRIRLDPVKRSVSLDKVQKDSSGVYNQVGSGRALLRSEADRIQVMKLSFRRLTLNAVRIHIELRGVCRDARRHSRSVDFTAESLIQMPSVHP